MGMVRVEENRRAIGFSQAPYDRNQLRDADETPLRLGGTNDDRNALLPRGFDNPIQGHEIGGVEMADRGLSRV